MPVDNLPPCLTATSWSCTTSSARCWQAYTEVDLIKHARKMLAQLFVIFVCSVKKKTSVRIAPQH